jgi:hypothetical protein
MTFVFDFKSRVDDIETHFEIGNILTFFYLFFHEDNFDVDLNVFLKVFARFHSGEVKFIIKIDFGKLFDEINIVQIRGCFNHISDFFIFEGFDIACVLGKKDFGLKPFDRKLVGICGANLGN